LVSPVQTATLGNLSQPRREATTVAWRKRSCRKGRTERKGGRTKLKTPRDIFHPGRVGGRTGEERQPRRTKAEAAGPLTGVTYQARKAKGTAEPRVYV